MAKISYHNLFLNYHNFITILCCVGFTILSEQCSQNNFPIIKTSFQGNKIKKEWWIFRPKCAKIKKSLLLFSLLLKIRNKDTHYK